MDKFLSVSFEDSPDELRFVGFVVVASGELLRLVVETISPSLSSSKCEKPQFFLIQSLLKPFPHHIFFKLRLCVAMTV